MTPDNKLEADRLAKLRALEGLGIDPWGGRFDGRTAIAAIREMPVPEDPATGPTLRAAGRVLSMRRMGKLRFFDLADQSGRIQIMASKQIAAPGWEVLEQVDL